MYEVWAVVGGFEDYEVSNKGRVRRMTTKRGVSAGILIRPRQAAIDNMTEVI